LNQFKTNGYPHKSEDVYWYWINKNTWGRQVGTYQHHFEEGYTDLIVLLFPNGTIESVCDNKLSHRTKLKE
jgi:hypothetical protein